MTHGQASFENRQLLMSKSGLGAPHPPKSEIWYLHSMKALVFLGTKINVRQWGF